VRLRLAGGEARGRVEAIEHTLAVEEEQPVLRPPRGGEEEQRQLIGRQQLLLVETERDLPIALCQVPGDVGEAAPCSRAERGPTLENYAQALVCRPCRCAGSRGLTRLSVLLARGDDARDSVAENAVQNAARSAAPALCRCGEQQLQQRHRLPLQTGSKRHLPRRQQPQLSLLSHSPLRPAEEPTAVSSEQTPFALPVLYSIQQRNVVSEPQTGHDPVGGEGRHIVAALSCGAGGESPLRTNAVSEPDSLHRTAQRQEVGLNAVSGRPLTEDLQDCRRAAAAGTPALRPW
jgi:hypothetical protein